MQKIQLISMDGDGQKVTAQFNPSEIQLGKKVPWQAKKHIHGNIPDLEYTEASAETLSFELMFDGYTDGKDVYIEHVSKLLNMMKPGRKGHPPKIEVVWGGFPKFQGVIEGVNVKYIMFFSNGAPARATASVTMTQADYVRAAVKGSVGADAGITPVKGERADNVAAQAGYIASDGQPDTRGMLNDRNPPDGRPEIDGDEPVTMRNS